MNFFHDIRSAKWLYAKGILFAVLALVAGGSLILQAPHLDILALLVICVWASCRAYYFAFYVIEHYVDPDFRFAGLVDFAKYAIFGPNRQTIRGVHRRGDDELNRGGQRGTHE